MKLLFISLGCDKNLVDTEHMLSMITQDGITITNDENEADIIVVNSCFQCVNSRISCYKYYVFVNIFFKKIFPC